MSSQMNTYVMYGFILPYIKLRGRSDEFEAYCDSVFKGIEHTDGICMLFDGMCGEYVAIGRVLAKTRNHEGFDKPVSLRQHPLMDDADVVAGQIMAVLGAEFLDGAQIGFHVISHYR